MKFSITRLLTCVVAAVVALTVSSGAFGAVIYVSKAGDDANPGANWGLAKHSIAAGLGAAASGDQVWVAAGSYWENITLKDGVALYGGFPANGGAWESRDWQANVAQINGGQTNTVVNVAYDAGTGTRIDGFTIQNGRADVGAGIRCYRSSPVIANNRIIWNTATGYNSYGGGIACENSSPTITGNSFESNTAAYGAGIYCAAYSQPVITGNTFTGNTGTYGGGIYCADYSSPVISGNTISGTGSGVYCDADASPSISGNSITDTVAAQGAGVYCAYSAPLIHGNTISGNRATDSGGGVFCYDASPSIIGNIIVANRAITGAGVLVKFDSSPVVCNNTIVANIGSGYGGGGIAWYGNSATAANNICFGNSAGIYSDAYSYGSLALQNNCVFNNGLANYSGISADNGDIALDPLLVNLAAGDYHLSAQSPCINKGSNSASLLDTDIDGQGRTWAGTVDIGADEFWATVTGLAEAKNQMSGSWVEADGVCVSAAFDGFFYVETDDRASGIRVSLPEHTVQEGARINVTGMLQTGPEGERYIDAATAEP